MTAPLDRAMESINSKVEEIYASEKIPTNLDLAKAAFESVDTDQLTAIILRTELPGGIKVGHADKIALAVKNWLTGKDQQ